MPTSAPPLSHFNHTLFIACFFMSALCVRSSLCKSHHRLITVRCQKHLTSKAVVQVTHEEEGKVGLTPLLLCRLLAGFFFRALSHLHYVMWGAFSIRLELQDPVQCLHCQNWYYKYNAVWISAQVFLTLFQLSYAGSVSSPSSNQAPKMNIAAIMTRWCRV